MYLITSLDNYFVEHIWVADFVEHVWVAASFHSPHSNGDWEKSFARELRQSRDSDSLDAVLETP